eukprot:NODE_2994_length_468_cov_36.580645_g2944_i0.p1 GENE.NODE_2994_length_468_cov_36.580645_g2944_i0~~NODE_2994_length_468_cov_36.580645_g2944_i0.p1  ORF type:complete len:126 (+),score=14.33 NODE_2994_length_468_cov_36.580645_g2944_i0:76-453(+)
MSPIQRVGSVIKDGMVRSCHATVYNGLIHVGGQVADTKHTDVESQTTNCLDKLDSVLKECGSDKSHLLQVTIYLPNIKENFAAMNASWFKWVDQANPPTRTCVEANLAREVLLVEISATAVVVDK